MQLKVTMRTSRETAIPFNYNHQLQSAIYAKLREVGYSGCVHNGGYSSSHIYKAFIFGALEGKHTVTDGRFVFADELSFEFRSPVFDLFDAFGRSFDQSPYFRLFDCLYKVVRTDIGNVHFTDGEILFSANSPVTVFSTMPDGKTVFFEPGSDEFLEYILLNYRNKYAAIIGGEAPAIDLTPLPPHRKIVTRYKKTWINAFKGNYLISGSSSALEFIYNTGLGAKNSQGFGMLDALPVR